MAALLPVEVAIGRQSNLAPLDLVDGPVLGGEVVKFPFLLWGAGLKHLRLDSRARASQELYARQHLPATQPRRTARSEHGYRQGGGQR